MIDDPDNIGGAAPSPQRQRKIIHVDMDAFYASIGQRDNPDLRGKPVAVGGSRERGVVAAASYAARTFGIRSTMPPITARRQCPELIFVKPRFEVYREVSLQIRGIFAEHTEVIEPLSLDEAYLDVTEDLQDIPFARDIALQIRATCDHQGQDGTECVCRNFVRRIPRETRIRSLASDHRKPNGQYVITPEMGPAFVETLPVGKFHGIGPATTAKLNSFGIFTGFDLRNQSLDFLQTNFGKAGTYYHSISRSRSSSGAIASRDELGKEAVDLSRKLMPIAKAIRLLGVSVSGFTDETEGNTLQMALAL
jgi:DNA polymerase-4